MHPAHVASAPLSPGPDLLVGPTDGTWVRRLVPLTALVTTHDCMQAVLDAGVCSETPDEPIWVRVRDDVVGRYEIADGHHRVGAALRAGHTHLWADIDIVPDDEPYEAPFYDFSPV